MFFCFSRPGYDSEKKKWTEEAGTVKWYLYDLEKDEVLADLNKIFESIKSKPKTPRKCIAEEGALIEIRGKVLKHIKNTYLKQVNAPIGVNPILKAWMELNEG